MHSFPLKTIYLRDAPSAVFHLPRLHANRGVSQCAKLLRFIQTSSVPPYPKNQRPFWLTDPWGKLALLRIQLRMLCGSLGLGRCGVPFPDHPFNLIHLRAAGLQQLRDDFGHPSPEYYGRHVASRARHQATERYRSRTCSI